MPGPTGTASAPTPSRRRWSGRCSLALRAVWPANPREENPYECSERLPGLGGRDWWTPRIGASTLDDLLMYVHGATPCSLTIQRLPRDSLHRPPRRRLLRGAAHDGSDLAHYFRAPSWRRRSRSRLRAFAASRFHRTRPRPTSNIVRAQAARASRMALKSRTWRAYVVGRRDVNEAGSSWPGHRWQHHVD
jgi:hypothetical protein